MHLTPIDKDWSFQLFYVENAMTVTHLETPRKYSTFWETVRGIGNTLYSKIVYTSRKENLWTLTLYFFFLSETSNWQSDETWEFCPASAGSWSEFSLIAFKCRCLGSPLLGYVFPLRSLQTFIIIDFSKCVLYYLDAHIFHTEKLYTMSAPSSNLCRPRLLFLSLVIIAFYIQVMVLGGDFSSFFV